jgi:hypothetical protein
VWQRLTEIHQRPLLPKRFAPCVRGAKSTTLNATLNAKRRATIVLPPTVPYAIQPVKKNDLNSSAFDVVRDVFYDAW